MSHSEPTPRRNWPWVVAVLGGVVVIVVGASVLSSVLGHPSGPKNVASATSSSPAPSQAPTTDAPTSAAPADASGDDGLTDTDVTTIQAAVEANDPADLYEYLSDPVHIEFAASDFDSNRSPDNAITDLEYIQGSTGWNWKLDGTTLTSFRSGAYGDQFPKGAIVGESAEGYVISFTTSGAEITDVFVSKTVDLVTAKTK